MTRVRTYGATRRRERLVIGCSVLSTRLSVARSATFYVVQRCGRSGASPEPTSPTSRFLRSAVRVPKPSSSAIWCRWRFWEVTDPAGSSGACEPSGRVVGLSGVIWIFLKQRSESFFIPLYAFLRGLNCSARGGGSLFGGPLIPYSNLQKYLDWRSMWLYALDSAAAGIEPAISNRKSNALTTMYLAAPCIVKFLKVK